MPSRQLKLGVSLTALMLFLATPQGARAGDIDTHLTSTYYLARKAGFNHRDAHMIAKGNWSMDLNGSTTALPIKSGNPRPSAGDLAIWAVGGPKPTKLTNFAGDLSDPGVASQWQNRGQRFHVLGSTPTEARANLVQLNRDFQASTATGDTRLAQLGQYLHATQDAYFHQHDGEPHGSLVGHLFSGEGGHAADKVSNNFINAWRSNEATYEILKQYKASGGQLPTVPDASSIYRSDVDRAEMQRMLVSENESQAYALTKAVSDSYENSGTPDGKLLNQETLQKNVEALWSGPKTQADPFTVPAHLDQHNKFKIDYDGADAGKLLPDTAPTKQVWMSTPDGIPYQVTVRDPGGPVPPAGTPAPGQQQTNSTITGGQLANANPQSPTGAPNAPQVPPTSATQPSPLQPPDPSQQQNPSFVPNYSTPAPGQTPPPGQGQSPWAPPMGLGGPGGISLTMAAASRLAIDMNLDGIHFKDGRVVMAGKSGQGNKVDAALFLTAMRAACTGADPYMSLDADNGAAWIAEGDKAAEALWEQVKDDYIKTPTESSPEGLIVKAISARRDFPKQWAALAPKFPNLKTRLVFKPEWLKETRFGEIMYIADVLLKELSAGVPTLQAGREVRAEAIERYKSSDLRRLVHGLTENVGQLPPAPKSDVGHRLWFDLASDGHDIDPPLGRSLLDDDPMKASDPASLKLNALLRARGWEHPLETTGKMRRSVSLAGDAVDLTQVWPQIFVRAHDQVTGKDIPGTDPMMQAMAQDVNNRIAEFATNYQELRDLTEVFRLYVAAVGISQRDRRACDGIPEMPLLNSERSTKPLPEHHPSELSFVVAAYTFAEKDGRKVRWHYRVGSTNGGVSPSGRSYIAEAAAKPAETPTTRALRDEATTHLDKLAWTSPTGRGHVAITLDNDPEFVRTARLLSKFKPVTKEMAQQILPELAQLDLAPGKGGRDNGDPRGATTTPPAGAGAVTPAPAKGDGMLDDVDPTEGQMVIVPR